MAILMYVLNSLVQVLCEESRVRHFSQVKTALTIWKTGVEKGSIISDNLIAEGM